MLKQLNKYRASRSLAKTGFVCRRPADFLGGLLNKEISLLRIRWRGKKDVVIRRYVEMLAKVIVEAR